jgi:hypothetical protein
VLSYQSRVESSGQHSPGATQMHWPRVHTRRRSIYSYIYSYIYSHIFIHTVHKYIPHTYPPTHIGCCACTLPFSATRRHLDGVGLGRVFCGKSARPLTSTGDIPDLFHDHGQQHRLHWAAWTAWSSPGALPGFPHEHTLCMLVHSPANYRGGAQSFLGRLLLVSWDGSRSGTRCTTLDPRHIRLRRSFRLKLKGPQRRAVASRLLRGVYSV